MQLLIGILLFLWVIVAVAMQRVYSAMPLKELRRQARRGDEVAQVLHRLVAYGHSLTAILWFGVIVSQSFFFIYVASRTTTLVAVLLVMFSLWFGYLWVPAERATHLLRGVAAKLSPLLSRVLEWLHPLMNRIATFIQKYRPLHIHTGMYELEDLVSLLRKQAQQADNRIDIDSLQVAEAALQYAEKPLHSIITPRRVVHTVAAHEPVGPVLMDELHGTGFSRFPVYGDDKDKFVGVLFLRDLAVSNRGKTVADYMHQPVCYIHEDQTLKQALGAILKTHQQLFIVVNSFEEYVGVVSIEDILEEIIGKQIVDEFDQYEDMRSVAHQAAQLDNHENYHPVKEMTTEDETEVVK
jgi:CBS domain containing-hemolysin-like protein